MFDVCVYVCVCVCVFVFHCKSVLKKNNTKKNKGKNVTRDRSKSAETKRDSWTKNDISKLAETRDYNRRSTFDNQKAPHTIVENDDEKQIENIDSDDLMNPPTNHSDSLKKTNQKKHNKKHKKHKNKNKNKNKKKEENAGDLIITEDYETDGTDGSVPTHNDTSSDDFNRYNSDVSIHTDSEMHEP